MSVLHDQCLSLLQLVVLAEIVSDVEEISSCRVLFFNAGTHHLATVDKELDIDEVGHCSLPLQIFQLDLIQFRLVQRRVRVFVLFYQSEGDRIVSGRPGTEFLVLVGELVQLKEVEVFVEGVSHDVQLAIFPAEALVVVVACQVLKVDDDQLLHVTFSLNVDQGVSSEGES